MRRLPISQGPLSVLQLTKRWINILFQKIGGNEQGMTMILALIAFCLGTLIIVPTLQYTATTAKSTVIYQSRAKELYAADAGVEYAVWDMKNDLVSPYPRSYSLADVNGYSINITLVRVNKEIYKVTSVAGGTTIVAHTAPPRCMYFAGDQIFDQNTIIDNNVYVEGNCQLGQSSEVHGDLYVVGDLWLNQCNRVDGIIYATGSIVIDRLPGWTIQIGGYIYSGGDLTIDQDVIVNDEIWAVGNIIISQHVLIQGDATAGGTVTFNPSKTIINGVVTEGYGGGDWPPPPGFVDDRHKLIGYKIN